MRKLTVVGCAVVALTAALAACSDGVLTSPDGRVPAVRSSVVSPAAITTQTVCSGAGILVDHGQTLPSGNPLAAVQVFSTATQNVDWHAPISLNSVNSNWITVNDPLFTAANAPDDELTHYQASFSVPANNTGALDGSSFADNQMTAILINNTGTSLGANATLDDADNYETAAHGGVALTYSKSGIAPGNYTLDFYVANNAHVTGTNPTAVDFCFEVVNTPNPAPAVALFVIGNDQPHAIDDIVNFWGAQWWKNNPTSITSDNGWESFKGFAPVSDNVCGGKWSSGPGNSDPPPAAPLPSSINIIVTDKVNKSGNTLSGNIVQIITVTQDGHYQANPGHAGNGTVTAVVCPAG